MRNAKYFMSINPSTNKIMKEFPFATAQDVGRALERGHAAFRANKKQPLTTRVSKILKMADLLEARKDECARCMAQEMGKPIKFGRLELNEVIGLIKHKAALAEIALQPKLLGPSVKKAYTLPQPTGIHFCTQPSLLSA